MKNDPIVEEVRRARAKLLDESGGDLEKYINRLRSQKHGGRKRISAVEEIPRSKPAMRRMPPAARKKS